MNLTYTDDDASDAPPGHLPLAGTDLELCFTCAGNDAVVHVNKAGILICRIRLQEALCALTPELLMRFSTYAPDFVFKVGDSRDGLQRLQRALGID